MSAIETHRISAEQPFHTRDKVRPWSLGHEMKMIAHQTIAWTCQPGFRASLAEYFQEGFSIDIVAKDCLPPVPSVQQMVERVLVFDSELAGHAGIFTKMAVAVSRVRTDPYRFPKNLQRLPRFIEWLLLPLSWL